MQMTSLRDLFVNELRDLYNAENQILKALPRMAKNAASDELREAFEEHREQTETHVQRLEQIFSKLEERPSGKKCLGLEGIIEEGKELMKEDAGPEVLDAGLIAAAQKVEHYEMAGYGSVRDFAKILGDEEAAELLEQTLEEEKETDRKLTGIAEQINASASSEGREFEGEEDGQQRRSHSSRGTSTRNRSSSRSRGHSRRHRSSRSKARR